MELESGKVEGSPQPAESFFSLLFAVCLPYYSGESSRGGVYEETRRNPICDRIVRAGHGAVATVESVLRRPAAL